MKRRKMLIVITLVTIMLLSCVAPIMQVSAADNVATETTMTFNSALYKGLKAYFQEVGIEAKYDDIAHTIKMSSATLEGITEISLKEKGIEDITGLDYFTNVSSLILSANDISEKSNLEVLNNFQNLQYLDLSSNEITDVSGIQDKILSLLAVDSNSVNLSGQTANTVVDVSVNNEEENLVYETTLPQILEIAGIAQNGTIENQGLLKSEWIVEYNQPANLYSALTPYVVRGSIPNPITPENNKFEIQVGADGENSYIPLEGLVKVVIRIKDTSAGSYNTNPATKNILKDSTFTLFFVVHTSEKEGIIFKDKNLYTAVKEQLTANQTINKDLISYPYSLTEEGETYYDVCNYSVNGTTATLTIDGEILYRIYNFGQSNEYIVDDLGNRYDVDYEFVDESVPNNNGVITTTRLIKIPHINSDCRNLYVAAYDEALALVITDLDLINKIGSLILNDQRITDLSGLEKFVGLESDLNVSYNYIDTLATIYALQINKENINSDLQNAYKEKRSAMDAAKSKIVASYEKVISAMESIENEIKGIEEKLAKLAEATTDEERANIKKDINNAVNKIYGYVNEQGEEVPGLIEEVKKALNDPQEGLNINLGKIYPRLSAMYDVFDKEYKLISILIPELNYLTEEEYKATQEKLQTLEGAKGLATSQASRIETLEKANALNELEKNLIVTAFGLVLSDEQEYPISYALNELIKAYEETGVRRTTWKNVVSKFEEINIYSAISNYCLIERMNNDVAAEECFAKEYLLNQIEEYEYEGIDTTILESIYNRLRVDEGIKVEGTTTAHTANLYNVFKNYMNGSRKLTNGSTTITAEFCEGTYREVTDLYFDITNTTNSGVTYPATIKLVETLEGGYENTTDMFFYNQLMTLANRFTAIDEVSRYVVVPSLKRLDVRNNKLETLGDTEVTMIGEDGTEQTSIHNLASLKNLKEFYAGHNFVTGDISCVDWSQLISLKKLDLSYNYIKDILPLEVLVNLRYLNVSDNLLEGAFNLSIRNMEKLEDLILAGNRYEDINKIFIDYEMIAEGDFTRYFAREDTVNLDLSRQMLEIVIEEPFVYDSSVTVAQVELPPIFSQLEYIDAARTAFGTTSTKGTIVATGEVAYIPVNEMGNYEGKVTVIAANGYPEDVTTSVGINTECVIKYSVQYINVDSVVINENITKLPKGATQSFTATVKGTSVPDTSVIWTVTGANSASTTINENGVLTIGADETSGTITITATSKYDETKQASQTIEVYSKEVTAVTVTGDATGTPGSKVTFTAEVIGQNLEDTDKGVKWEVYGNTTPYTMINPVTGELTIDSNEKAEALIVSATSKYDETKFGTAEIKLSVVRGITIKSNGNRVDKGGSMTFTATLEGTGLGEEDQSVTWEVSGATDPETTITAEGVLTVGNNETAEKLIVTAKSVMNPEIYGTKEIKIATPLPELGYELDDNDETLIIGVSPSTKTSTFKSKLITADGYTVVVKRNGETVSDTTNVATGDMVVIYSGDTLLETYEIVVKGDVNGDGLADALDSSLIKAHRARLTTLTGAFLRAADIDNDDEVSVQDVRLLLYHRARIEGYIL